MTPSPSPTRRTALVLAILAVAFLGRVVGQLVVMASAPAWLPPAEEWYSGLLPYPLLLPSQLAILGLQWMVTRDIWRGTGRFARPSPRTGTAMRWVSIVYFVVMVIRYVVTMAHAIPIIFHWVLAAYLLVWSRYLQENGTVADRSR